METLHRVQNPAFSPQLRDRCESWKACPGSVSKDNLWWGCNSVSFLAHVRSLNANWASFKMPHQPQVLSVPSWPQSTVFQKDTSSRLRRLRNRTFIISSSYLRRMTLPSIYYTTPHIPQSSIRRSTFDMSCNKAGPEFFLFIDGKPPPPKKKSIK